MMGDLLELRHANVQRQREWDTSGNITLSFRGLELGGEAGEAQNIIKKIERQRMGIDGSRATVDQLADELADVIICCDLIAMDTGINLAHAVADKFNQTSKKVGLKTRLELTQTSALKQLAISMSDDDFCDIVMQSDVASYLKSEVLVEAKDSGKIVMADNLPCDMDAPLYVHQLTQEILDGRTADALATLKQMFPQAQMCAPETEVWLHGLHNGGSPSRHSAPADAGQNGLPGSRSTEVETLK